MRIAWVLNLDADDELRHPTGYMVSRGVLQRMAALARHVHALARPGDVILADTAEPAVGDSLESGFVGQGFLGQAWCPTPRALARLARAGVHRPPTPPLAVLRRVNHRGFCAELGQTLESAHYVQNLDELRAHISKHPWPRWILKRPHGFSGRGSKRVELPWSALHPQVFDWIRASLEGEDGLQVEPWVERERDLVMHGYVHAQGNVRLGFPCVQVCDAYGAWVQTTLAAAGDLSDAERDALHECATSTARALARSGYFGPFGIDAYRWRDPEGKMHLNPRSDLNARYTMGWHVGMDDWRPDSLPEAE